MDFPHQKTEANVVLRKTKGQREKLFISAGL